MSKEEAAKLDAMQKAFDEGIKLTQAGKLDEAIAKFSEAKATNPDCFACQFNIGPSNDGKEGRAEGRGSVPRGQRAQGGLGRAVQPAGESLQREQAVRQGGADGGRSVEALRRRRGGAGGGASAESLFDQGVVLWNGQKIAEAKVQFEAAVKAKPDYADAHYWLGMANLNTNQVPAARASFENYLKYAPTGQYAEQVKGFLTRVAEVTPRPT